MILTVIRIETLYQAQLLRLIRNNCKEYMTNYRTHITPEQQEKWYRNVLPTLEAYLFFDPNEALVGFGLIRDGWGTLGLLEEFRGLGYGVEIYQFLTSINPNLMIEVFADNSPSLISALKAGFEPIHIIDKLVQLKWNKDD